MSLPEDRHARIYYRVAKQRLEDADILFEAGRFNSAVYLAGYAVECIWKAIIIEKTRRSHRMSIVATLRGSRGHDLDWLRAQYRQSGSPPFRKEVNRSMILVSSWQIDLRYKSGLGDRAEASEFLRAVEAVVREIDGRI